MTSDQDLFQQALLKTRLAYQQGNLQKAHEWALKASALDPSREEAWLWLAAVSNPQDSIDHLKKALAINPQSERARKGMHWAITRLRASPPQVRPSVSERHSVITAAKSPPTIKPTAHRGLQFTTLQWILILSILTLMVVAVSARPVQMVMDGYARAQNISMFTAAFQKASLTPLPSDTPTVTPSLTSTPTATATLEPTQTATPLPSDTPTTKPTKTRKAKTPTAANLQDVGKNERWIDVDLTKQQVYAYEGTELVNTFIVSTGTWLHPTVTGSYYIYVKYESAPMWGPDYYLPGVPYIMYFYEGYGLHGTYWHNNFGTPMSHGCINLKTEDAEWLFYWASIGTLVHIHY